ncbi:MAG: Swt1 family HEPN domain-containing protein [Desulforegulaceae bacterium]|nr:Swt1 family HEPN domain-containing protein [Desulforegulaceae bacterium]
MNNNKQFNGEMAKHLSSITLQIAIFLNAILPKLYKEDWWTKTVINTLSFQQKNRIEQNQIKTLDKLDLAALLRILDQNWYQISSSLSYTSEKRHFVKEMITIRNKWAHADASGFNQDDIYRDLDTIQRFAGVINAEPKIIQELKETKNSILSRGNLLPVNNIENKNMSSADTDTLEFQPGKIVSLKSNPDITGAVIQILPGDPENRYNVFINDSIQTFYGSQLVLQSKELKKEKVLSSNHFHAYLSALQINYPGLSSLYSLNAARVDFIPYQFRPVLRFIKSDRPRLLIADGVGVGKTIEAGLILREIQARREISSVLIICPRPLVTERKWEIEMKRFEERFVHLDGPTLRYCINETDMEGTWPQQYQKAIIPYSLFDESLLNGLSKKNKSKGLIDLDPPPKFDMVIVDEAHHIRNENTFRHKAVNFFCDHAEAVVFLTATPIQLGNKDLYVLLKTLRPDIILDQQSFKHMAEPNPYINKAVSAIRAQENGWQKISLEALNQAASTSWGQAILRHNPNFKEISKKLLNGETTTEERVSMITDVEEMHTFSSIINRTRRSDIGNFTIRKPETIKINFTTEQKKLHDEILKIQAEIYTRLHNGVNVKFMMTTIRRQCASCLFGLAPLLDEILNRHLDELAWEESDNTTLPDDKAIDSIQDEINYILELARTIDSKDPKLEALINIIKDKQKLFNNKLMLFSSFRHTLNYLYKHLKNKGFRVGLINGDTPDEERINLRKRFEKLKDHKDCIDLLLFSEIGCEGLDYQFCDCIINYDLPWNPMRIEQRIGRIDRNGQKSESIAIINLITPGTVDADIYERCLLRIGVFNNAIGASEEILGEITLEIKNIAENYELTEKERNHKFQLLADNKIRLIQEQETLEKKQLELFGIQLPIKQMNKKLEDASNFWLSPDSIFRLVNFYLSNLFGKEQDYILGDKKLKTLRLSQEHRNSLLKDFQKINRQNNVMYREWETWLKGSSPHLPITFESDCARDNSKAAFIMPIHPLVKQASRFFEIKEKILTKLEVKSKIVPPGEYEFVIYQWKFYGIREDLILMPIASKTLLNNHLNKLLETAVDSSKNAPDALKTSLWDNLDGEHYKLWNEAKAKHKQRTQELAEFRRESLSTSHSARIALLEEQLNQASDVKIQKMRQSQIITAEADYARRIQELDIAVERADIVAGAVAYGIITILEEN